LERNFREKLNRIKPIKLNCICFRALHKDYTDPLNTDGNLKVFGRWHIKGSFRALYTSESRKTCIEELKRKVEDSEIIESFRIHALEIDVTKILDLSKEENLRILKLEKIDILYGSIENPEDIIVPNTLAKCVYELGFEGILVDSVTNIGKNIIIFPQNLKIKSFIKKLIDII